MTLAAKTPGPSQYTIVKKEMGDASSVKVCFPTAPRPISARPGELKRI